MWQTAQDLFNGAPTQAVVTPARQTRELSSDSFTCELSALRFPTLLDFSHANFKLRELNMLKQVRDSAIREINVSGNELHSLEVLNRFHQLRSVAACANTLQVGAGLVLRLPRLQELDLASNKLLAVPPLSDLPQLQALRLQRNQISRNWSELSFVSKSLKDLDVSHNRLNWVQSNGEFDAAMQVLNALKGLKELRLGGNPISETPALRYLVINYAPKLMRLDGLPVTEVERRGKVSPPHPTHLTPAPTALASVPILPSPPLPPACLPPPDAWGGHCIRSCCGGDGASRGRTRRHGDGDH